MSSLEFRQPLKHYEMQSLESMEGDSDGNELFYCLIEQIAQLVCMTLNRIFPFNTSKRKAKSDGPNLRIMNMTTTVWRESTMSFLLNLQNVILPMTRNSKLLTLVFYQASWNVNSWRLSLPTTIFMLTRTGLRMTVAPTIPREE